jgi:FMN phosphatase YigB (HAD superfamily)
MFGQMITIPVAFRHQSSTFPNYGKREGMLPQTWWSQIIDSTLFPVLSDLNIPEDVIRKTILPDLSQQLLRHFSSKKGYSIHEDSANVLETIRNLRDNDKPGSRTIVGVVSNSDPRVGGILRSFGLNVSSTTPNNISTRLKPYYSDDHIDFLVLSYDIGFEKPSPEMFKAAENVARDILPPSEAQDPISKLYVGDDLEKDSHAAAKLGWDSILIDRHEKYGKDFSGLDQILHIPTNEIQQNTRIQRVSNLWPMDSSSLWPWDKEILQTKSRQSRFLSS